MPRISWRTGKKSNRLIINGKPEYYYTVDSMPEIDFYSLPICRKKGKHCKTYYNISCTFDIETTNVLCETLPYAFMYHWQFCFANQYVIFGRTWEEYKQLLSYLHEKLELTESKRLVIYVHNLAFEFQFLYSQLDGISEVFARKARKIMKFYSDGFEYRCSYMLSNMSLEKFCENSVNCEHYKLSGTYDYKKMRYPWTPLTPHELKYCYNDVKGLAECIESRLLDDDIASMPLTSTGYVRRDFRKAMQSNPDNIKVIKKLSLTVELYTLLKEAFRGGNTHANAFYTGITLKNITSRDLASSYPAAMLIDKYPMSPFINANPAKFKRYLADGKAMLFRIKIDEVFFTAEHGVPYMPIAKCRHIKNATNDNGRVLAADTLEITLTDIDYKIICMDYSFTNLRVANLYISDYGYLPDEYRNEIIEYYKAKTMLKGVESKEYEYMKSKNRLNSSYGMMVTDIINDDIIFRNGEWSKTEPDAEESIERHNNSKSTFLAYQWGVWVCANARKRLEDMLHVVGDDVIYTDTDSVKYLGNHDDDFKKMNDKIIALSYQCGIDCCVLHEGKENYMGIWDYDGSYDYFKTLGAKKYIYVKKGKATITVAGLSKKLSSIYINSLAKRKHCNPCDLFEKGFIFSRSSGRTSAHYNDVSRETLMAEGKRFTSGSNIAITDATYILGVTAEYEELIKLLQDENTD